MNFKNIKDLITDAHLYQYADIADTDERINKKKPKAFFTKTQWIILVFSIAVNFILYNGYNIDFCGYVISGLSLFVGIFFTFIIALYDKFNNVDFSKYQSSVNEDKSKLGIRLKNYFKKTTVLSLYLIILAIVCILLLSCTLLSESFFNQRFCPIELLSNFRDYSFSYLMMASGILLYRSIVFYFMIDFVMITVYLTASIFDFLISEYNKVKIK